MKIKQHKNAVEISDNSVGSEITMGWVALDGTSGIEDIIVFDSTIFTDEDWEIWNTIEDKNRFSFVRSVLDREKKERN